MPVFPARFAFLIFLLLAVAAGFYSSKLKLLEDVTAMLPDRDEDHSNFAKLARESGLMERVVVAVGPGEPGSEELFAAMDASAEAVSRLDGVARVMSKMDTEGARSAAMLLLESGARLYRPGTVPVTSKDVAARLASLKVRLASPEALVMQPYLLADPLGFSRDALMGLESAGSAMGANIDQGRLVSGDGRWGLIIADLDFDPFEVERSARFVEVLDGVLGEVTASDSGDSMSFLAVGGVHFAAASAGAVRADITQAFVLTCVGILLVFGLFFRRLRVVPAALVPGGLGIATAAGLMGAAGVEIHALTLGFAATITGISVDYVIHLLFRASRSAGENSLARMKEALRAIVRPVSLGCATTVAAFLLVATSEFPGMKQLALFSCISIPVALLATFLLIPPFHRLLIGESPVRRTVLDRALERLPELTAGGGPGKRVAVIIVFVALIAGFSTLAAGVRLSGDPRDMGYFDDGLERRLGDLRKLMPGLDGQTLLVTSAKELDEALYRNDSLYQSLIAAGMGADNIISVSPFLPGKRTQEASLASVEELFKDNSLNLRKVFLDSGFSQEYFGRLSEKQVSKPISIESFENTGLARLIDDSVSESEKGFNVLTRVIAKSDEDLDRLLRTAEKIDGCTLLSERGEAKRVLETMQIETARMLLLWIGVSLVIISLVQRSLFFGLRALLPAVFGVACAAGFFGILGRPMTPVATAGLTLVMGLGIDYGIFMQNGDLKMRSEAAPAVLASALTTLVAFGVLAGSRTSAMADVGLVILVGVSAAVAAAVLFVPAVHGVKTTGDER